ncbi:MAG: hypothetical protein LUF92_01450 [Clostridiales bacterium]|nr:hypothetical protein [Clostridiales bacterium]
MQEDNGKILTMIRMGLLMVLFMAILLIPSTKIHAASRTGTYQKHFTSSSSSWDSYRTVVIKKITKKKVVFQIQYATLSKEAYTKKIVGKRTGNKVTFTYYDAGWGERGKGTMKLSKNYIKIKTTTTSGSGFIGTSGKYFKLKRVSSKKKFAG